MCAYPDASIKLPHWKCVLRCCANCPTLVIPDEESNPHYETSRIKFHVYQDMTKCSLHGSRPLTEVKKCSLCDALPEDALKGSLSTRKNLVLHETSINEFHANYYSTAIAKLAFHLPHVQILGTNEVGNTRRQALHSRASKQDCSCKRDYAERFSDVTAIQVHSQHWGGNRTLSMEGVALEYFPSTASQDTLCSISFTFV